MSMFVNENIELEKFIENVKEAKYILPNFEEKEHWKTAEIENLGGSIIKSIPMFLFLAKQDGENLNIVDGQQRITALSKIFLDSGEDTYYFDYFTILAQKYQDKIIMDKCGSNATELCKAFSVKPANANFRYVPASIMLKREYITHLDEFISLNFSNIEKDKRQKYKEYLVSLDINAYSLIFTIVNEDADVEILKELL